MVQLAVVGDPCASVGQGRAGQVQAVRRAKGRMATQVGVLDVGQRTELGLEPVQVHAAPKIQRRFLAGSIAVGVNPERATSDAELAGRLGGRGYPRVFLVARVGAAPVQIPTLARQENEALEPVVRKFMAAVQEQTGVPAANARR